ncbi:hypothetical protein BpHYR1_035913 [Brachionus plicatilis]|uniref:Uncharacterized protein n=1 Tax=Brachionus plicatilis TaxID=10195 RepID=A0A3M7QG33_BRAPC|nr:hypothetical protein BpHYR1_035913 [Brachionus plicatilis]
MNNNKEEFVNENNENHYDDLIAKIQQLTKNIHENEQKILKERFDEKTFPHRDTKETRKTTYKNVLRGIFIRSESY